MCDLNSTDVVVVVCFAVVCHCQFVLVHLDQVRCLHTHTHTHKHTNTTYSQSERERKRERVRIRKTEVKKGGSEVVHTLTNTERVTKDMNCVITLVVLTSEGPISSAFTSSSILVDILQHVCVCVCAWQTCVIDAQHELWCASVRFLSHEAPVLVGPSATMAPFELQQCWNKLKTFIIV